MAEYRKSSNVVYDIKYHIIWVTKYRYKILKKKIAFRLRELIKQGCESRKIKIIKGSIGNNHVYILVSCPPSLSQSKIVQYLKGHLSRLLRMNSLN